MGVYNICGLRLASNLPLPELVRSRAGSANCFFELLEPAAQNVIADRWVSQTCRPDGQPWRSCARRSRSYLVRFHRLADFSISAGGRRIRCTPDPRLVSDTLRHLLIDHVVPLCINLRGGECLHASAVAINGEVCGFLGGSGSGKSTLAASFVADGCELVADDCLVLSSLNRRIVAIPSHPGMRLWPEAAENIALGVRSIVAGHGGKKRFGVQRISSQRAKPVRALYVIGPHHKGDGGAPHLERLAPASGMIELTRNAFQLDPTCHSTLARQFRSFGRFVRRIPIYCVRYPRDFSILPAVRKLIAGSLTTPGIAGVEAAQSSSVID